MYVAIDGNLENACTIQNACCSRNGTMMQLMLVKTVEEERNHQDPHLDHILHDIKILLHLVEPWLHSNQTVVSDSYISSVGPVC